MGQVNNEMKWNVDAFQRTNFGSELSGYTEQMINIHTWPKEIQEIIKKTIFDKWHEFSIVWPLEGATAATTELRLQNMHLREKQC